MDWGSRITYLAGTTFKDRAVTFGIKDTDRLENMCVIGRAGSGRSQLLARMALQDIERGGGTLVIDATGQLTQYIVERLDDESKERLILLDPSDGEYPYSWNPIDDFKKLERADAVHHLSYALSSVYRIPPSRFTELGAEFVIDGLETTMLTFYDLVTDQAFREKFLSEKAEKRAEFETLIKEKAEHVQGVNDNGRYLAKDTLIRNLFGQKESKFTFEALEKSAIIILDLSHIRVFPTRVTPLVRLFMHAARARAHASPVPIVAYLYDAVRYLDEVDIEKVFAERNLAAVIADTIYSEDDRPLREKALARCATVLSFAPHHADVPLTERMFYPYVSTEELEKLEDGEFCIALTIDAVRSKPFFARLEPLPERKNISQQDLMVIARERYATMRTKVDITFKKKSAPGDKKKKDDEPGSFTDAFRSIFQKKDDGTAKPEDGNPTQTKPEENKKEESKEVKAVAPQPKAPEVKKKKAPPPAEEYEIPEEDLRQMLYVAPVIA